MVKKYPPTLEELKRTRDHVPKSEQKFYEILDVLDDDWHAWHSVKWDCDIKHQSGEADFLLFNQKYGMIVIEVKGGLITKEHGTFQSTNQQTLNKHEIKDPFKQAEDCLHNIKRYYEKMAKEEDNSEELLNEWGKFPLNFNYGVFFPDTAFKSDFEYLPYRHFRVFDSVDYENLKDGIDNKNNNAKLLEQYLVPLLEHYKHLRIKAPGIKDFFPKLIGSNITNYLSLKKFFLNREMELESINKVQDFLLAALSEKRRCLFKGSAGSGKTFIAMKKLLLNYSDNKKTLFLCFNVELKNSIRTYIANELEEPYWNLEHLLEVHSINSFLFDLIKKVINKSKQDELLADLKEFSYEKISIELLTLDPVPEDYKYDAIIIDEAQDIDEHLWSFFTHLLRDPQDSIFYVFYDQAQALFVEKFSARYFDMDDNRDLIVLEKNLRNSIEIADWIKNITHHGTYNEFSGIIGFRVKRRRFSNSQHALLSATKLIRKDLLAKGVESEQIIILSYYKLSTITSKVKNDEKLGDYMMLAKGDYEKRSILIEPKKLLIHNSIVLRAKTDWVIYFKTITAFKGLERDVIYLLVPNFSDFEELYPDRYENFLMQVYVGASRAKFKLEIMEFNMPP